MDAAAHTDALNALCALLGDAFGDRADLATSYPAGTFGPTDSTPAALDAAPPSPITRKGRTKRSDAA